MKIKNKIILIIILVFLILLTFTNISYGATASEFNTWVEKNKEKLSELLADYDYVIVNNYYYDYIRIYYTLAPNNKFSLSEESPFRWK